MVHQLASRPGLLVDPYALIAAFEQLADICQETNHPERRRYEAIFKQCRLLVREPRLASVLIQLLGDKDGKHVAGQIHKLLKSSSILALFSGPYPQSGQFPYKMLVHQVCCLLQAHGVLGEVLSFLEGQMFSL